MTRRMLVALLIFLAPLPSATAAEQRCDDLGDRCLCSEPLNTNALPPVGDAWQNPADSSFKECTNLDDSFPGYALERPGQDLFGSDDAAVLGRLPAGHAVRYFVRGPDNHMGMWNVSHYPGAPSNVVRVAARWYMYRSADFDFAEDGTCGNSKLANFGGGALLDTSYGYVHMYNFLTWTPAKDCCMVGPGPDNVEKSDWRDSWMRVEIVFTNLSGPGFNAEVYLKNVTAGTPEIKVVDLTYGPTTDWTPSSSLTPPERMDRIAANLFRSLGGGTSGTCRGWQGISHFLFAGWPTNAGQRIGPAAEIEGGSATGDTAPPAPPRNLRVE